MKAQILDGQQLANQIKNELITKIVDFREKTGMAPGLAAILIGASPASQLYVEMKEKACQQTGIYSQVIRLPEKIDENKVIELIDSLNNNNKIHGILVQLPLPAHLNKARILEAVSPKKDVDGFHPLNQGRLLNDDPEVFVSCTPLGILRLLESVKFDFKGKQAVVVGRSIEVGKPLALLLLARHATVTICHSRTINLEEQTKRADILSVAIGRPKLITASMVKPGAIVIDVGTNKVEGKLVGDVDYAGVASVAGWITPVPGGVGPMTIAMLLENTLKAARLAQR
jgi:methylenetetrahydrofolate dehydrogenase (NADP+)/methenyltetrahydrofolate cyclohydrolase